MPRNNKNARRPSAPKDNIEWLPLPRIPFVHPDHSWVNSKLRKHGGGCFIGNKIDRPVKILNLYDSSKIIILWYNLVLHFRFLKRKYVKQ